MSKKKEKVAIPMRPRGPFHGAGPHEVDLKASPARLRVSPGKEELATQLDLSTGRFLPPAHRRQSRSFSGWLCHNIYVFRVGEGIAFRSRKIWKGWWWEFPQHVDFQTQLDPRLGVQAKPDCHLLTHSRGDLALFYCSVLTKMQLVSNGPWPPAIGMKESLIWDLDYVFF